MVLISTCICRVLTQADLEQRKETARLRHQQRMAEKAKQAESATENSDVTSSSNESPVTADNNQTEECGEESSKGRRDFLKLVGGFLKVGGDFLI